MFDFIKISQVTVHAYCLVYQRKLNDHQLSYISVCVEPIGEVKSRVFFCSCPCGQNKPPSSRLVETVQDLHGTGQLLCHSKWPQKWPLGLGHALKVTNSPFYKKSVTLYRQHCAVHCTGPACYLPPFSHTTSVPWSFEMSLKDSVK